MGWGQVFYRDKFVTMKDLTPDTCNLANKREKFLFTLTMGSDLNIEILNSIIKSDPIATRPYIDTLLSEIITDKRNLNSAPSSLQHT